MITRLLRLQITIKTMKKIILSLAFAGSLMIATSACNSSKNMAGSSDSTKVDSTTAPLDTTKTTTPPDTTKLPPDTTKKMPPM
ncbi:hypothetical protein SAMN04488023_12844 [Pedobacter rhizosphaerae]|uniref:Coproporphyrinogen III oxidase n=1 Tax=Pedobacter rhizosphaerae TaxID=390241 RepID=A0A1H9U7T8_9SPHI|nr:hypothetical protein SAMN04488023_12844 [Pedobacter rhizosphaerae]